jgi:glycosyltransferase involved in cell wall biosynthesis
MTGGSSRLVVDLIERLGLYRHTILTSFVPDPPAYRGAAVRVVGVASSIDAIRQAVAERPVALIHVHYWGEGDEPWYRHVLDALDGLGCPIIENVNTPVHPLRREGVARYVYVSRYVREHFGSSAYPEEVIYPGSDLSLFTRASAGAAVGDTIGMVYRLERDKLDDLSMEPFIEAVRARAGTRVLIVGGGTLLDPFQRRVREADVADRFTFTGYVAYHELPALYASMAVFAAPVWKESFGQVSSFAMSMGVPVAGYAVGAIPEIVDDPALVAPLHDSKGLARILCDLLDRPDLRAGIAARNLERVHALHSVDAMVARYRDLYAEVLETHV